MELKKTSKADLENKRNIFLLLGLVLSLGSILVAFEWESRPTQVSSLGDMSYIDVEQEIIPVTRQDELKPPPPPPPPKVVEILNIVDDDVDIEDELVIEDSEADDKTLIDISPVIISADKEAEENTEIFIIVEEMPEFPGGDKGLYSFINNTVRYPVIAQENGIQGKVYLRFVVDTDGTAKDGIVIRGVDPVLDSEALRVISLLPNFKPGKQRGKPVKVFYQALINFQLQ